MPNGLGLNLQGAGGAGAASQFMQMLAERQMKQQEMLQQARQQEAAEQYRQQVLELDRRQADQRAQEFGEQTRQFNVGQDRLLAKDAATAAEEAANQQGFLDLINDPTIPQDARDFLKAKMIAKRGGVDITSPHDLHGVAAEEAEQERKQAADQQEWISRQLFSEGLIRGRPDKGSGGDGGSWTWVDRINPQTGKYEATPVQRGQFLPGDRPHNAARDAMRHVTSGDVTRITDLDWGLTEARNLEQTLGKAGGTGAMSWIESKLVPNAAIEAGWVGAGAQGRLAQINLVKQIIGKGLEGGVLRKEDEIKYKDMLPLINDAPETAKLKIQQLQQALARKRELFIENLTDAGFVTEDFLARPGRGLSGATGTIPSATKPSGIKSITVISK